MEPPYTRYHPELGEITSYPPGYKENAGIFCHNNTWVHLGWCLLGDGDRALEYYRSICPSTQPDIETYRAEPYVYAQMIAGRDAATPGEAKNSWLTGTAAWTFVTLAQGILGIKPEYDGLRIDPCIPTKWGSYRVSRRFRGATYEITISNPDGVSTGVPLAHGRRCSGRRQRRAAHRVRRQGRGRGRARRQPALDVAPGSLRAFTSRGNQLSRFKTPSACWFQGTRCVVPAPRIASRWARYQS